MLNGDTVWQGSWCGKNPNSRGVIILVINPRTCTKKEYHNFDTHDNANEAVKLRQRLQKIRPGRIIG